MKTWWNALDPQRRTGFAAGFAAILLASALAGWWLLRTDYAVLFADLKPQDAAAMAAELDRQKVPYAVGDGGATLLVDKAQVHAIRMKLMGKDLPLHGAVGLELFNNTDFGMTEFAQKINYQRALQGELTRTILVFPEVRDARVHLALPEQGLFKQASSRPKAAITLSLRQGHGLRPEQVSGIQRLVAAAVPGLVAQEVTVVDQHGVALSRAADEGEFGAGGRLDLKRETENYLSRKAGAVLERAFGPGQALASVDVTLDMDQVRVTTEDVIAAPDAKGVATGVLVRERESARDNGGAEARDTQAGRASSMQRDVEYQTGRRVEQVVSRPGSIRRLHVVAVVRQPLDAQQQEQLRKLIAAAVGASAERGDAVLVQSFQLPPPAPREEGAVTAVANPPSQEAAENDVPLAGAAGVLMAALAYLLARSQAARRRAVPPAPLTDAQRQLALRKVEAWLRDGRASPPLDVRLAAEGGNP